MNDFDPKLDAMKAAAELSKTQTRKPVPGYRYFLCSDCGKAWMSTTRDCLSPSKEGCYCGAMIEPSDSVIDRNLDTDSYGNLKYQRESVCSPCNIGIGFIVIRKGDNHFMASAPILATSTSDNAPAKALHNLIDILNGEYNYYQQYSVEEREKSLTDEAKARFGVLNRLFNMD